jgi:drug/metabolite transporter (DMT)-like permease
LCCRLYFSVPLILQGGFGIELQDLPRVILLGVVPTLGGFFCTTKALDFLEASQVQLFEMSEPLFAGLMASGLLSQSLSLAQAGGGACILLGLFLAERMRAATVQT